MADLVVGDDVALLLGQHAALAFQPTDHAIDRLVEVGHVHRVLALAGREQGGLVHQVGEVGARHARVRAASTRRATLGAGMTLPALTCRVASAPLTSGLATTTWRSK